MKNNNDPIKIVRKGNGLTVKYNNSKNIGEKDGKGIYKSYIINPKTGTPTYIEKSFLKDINDATVEEIITSGLPYEITTDDTKHYVTVLVRNNNIKKEIPKGYKFIKIEGKVEGFKEEDFSSLKQSGALNGAVELELTANTSTQKIVREKPINPETPTTDIDIEINEGGALETIKNKLTNEIIDVNKLRTDYPPIITEDNGEYIEKELKVKKKFGLYEGLYDEKELISDYKEGLNIRYNEDKKKEFEKLSKKGKIDFLSKAKPSDIAALGLPFKVIPDKKNGGLKIKLTDDDFTDVKSIPVTENYSVIRTRKSKDILGSDVIENLLVPKSLEKTLAESGITNGMSKYFINDNGKLEVESIKGSSSPYQSEIKYDKDGNITYASRINDLGRINEVYNTTPKPSPEVKPENITPKENLTPVKPQQSIGTALDNTVPQVEIDNAAKRLEEEKLKQEKTNTVKRDNRPYHKPPSMGYTTNKLRNDLFQLKENLEKEGKSKEEIAKAITERMAEEPARLKLHLLDPSLSDVSIRKESDGSETIIINNSDFFKDKLYLPEKLEIKMPSGTILYKHEDNKQGYSFVEKSEVEKYNPNSFKDKMVLDNDTKKIEEEKRLEQEKTTIPTNTKTTETTPSVSNPTLRIDNKPTNSNVTSNNTIPTEEQTPVTVETTPNLTIDQVVEQDIETAKKEQEPLVFTTAEGNKKVIPEGQVQKLSNEEIKQKAKDAVTGAYTGLTDSALTKVQELINNKDYEGLANLKVTGITVNPDGSISTNIGGKESTIPPPSDKAVIRKQNGEVIVLKYTDIIKNPELLTGSTVISDPIPNVINNPEIVTPVPETVQTPQTPVETVSGATLLQQTEPTVTPEVIIPNTTSGGEVNAPNSKPVSLGISSINLNQPLQPLSYNSLQSKTEALDINAALQRNKGKNLPKEVQSGSEREMLKNYNLPPVSNSRLDATAKFNNLFNLGQTALENLVPENNTVNKPTEPTKKEPETDYTKWTEGDKLALAAVGLPSLINIGRGLFEKAETYQPIYNTQAGSALNEMVTRRLDIDRTDGRTKAIAARKVIQDNSTSSASRNANLMNLYGTSREFEDKISTDEAMYNDITMPAQNAQFRLGVGENDRVAREQARQYNIQVRQAKDNILTTGLGQLANAGKEAGNNLNIKASNEIAANAMQTSNYRLGKDYSAEYKDGTGVYNLDSFIKEIEDRYKKKAKETETPTVPTDGNKYGGYLGYTDLLPNFDLEQKNKEALLMLKSLTNKIRTTKKYK